MAGSAAPCKWIREWCRLQPGRARGCILVAGLAPQMFVSPPHGTKNVPCVRKVLDPRTTGSLKDWCLYVNRSQRRTVEVINFTWKHFLAICNMGAHLFFTRRSPHNTSATEARADQAPPARPLDVTARAGNRRFGLLSTLRAHAKAPYKTNLHRETPRNANAA
jgi:hypothetical protein